MVVVWFVCKFVFFHIDLALFFFNYSCFCLRSLICFPTDIGFWVLVIQALNYFFFSLLSLWDVWYGAMVNPAQRIKNCGILATWYICFRVQKSCFSNFLLLILLGSHGLIVFMTSSFTWTMDTNTHPSRQFLWIDVSFSYILYICHSSSMTCLFIPLHCSDN